MLDNQPRGTICIEDIEMGMTRYLQKHVTDRDIEMFAEVSTDHNPCLLYTSPSPRDGLLSRMPSSA